LPRLRRAPKKAKTKAATKARNHEINVPPAAGTKKAKTKQKQNKPPNHQDTK